MLIALIVCISAASVQQTFAVSRTSAGSGNYSSAATWTPSGVPTATDQLTILGSHTITVDNNSYAGTVTINSGGKLIWAAGKKLTVSNGFTVNGNAEITDGDIDLTQPGAPFIIGAAGTVIWQPANNTVAGATLFTNGIENFAPTSNLLINKWYNFSSVPLGSVVTGNFGNLSLTTFSNGLLFEWNQNNQFEQHKILGTLTIDQGWVVLDKSGSISNTVIGAINLKNVNSYLDFHSGDHPGSFTVKTNSLTNIGGVLNGLYDGNGNINLEVNGDVLNLGSIELIYNSGVQGKSNGNASMKITGLFKQTTGDFRGIFNLTSINSGVVNLEFENVEVTGGIFIAHYGCHTSASTSIVTVNQNLTLNFINATSKFRGNGLTSLGGVISNLKQQFVVKGDLIIKGNASAEFTSSGSGGQESFKVNGVTNFEGCTSNFNYGDHNTNLEFQGNTAVKGGDVTFSRTSGVLTVLFDNNLNITSGQLSVKRGAGNSNVTVNGEYSLSGGSMFMHNNTTEPASSVIYMTVNGNFTGTAGELIFDNNNSSTVKHILSLNGNIFTIGGTANITGSISSQSSNFGIIYYDKPGEMQYFENGSTAKIQNVKQVVSSGCTVKLMSGNMQASSSNFQVNDMIRVASGGTIDAGDRQIYSNSTGLYSGIKVDDGGRIRTSNSEGFYNGAANATIKANGNMTFYLQPLSVVEYYGSAAQPVTGTGIGTAQTTDQQYGVLEINKENAVARLASSNVTVRKGVDLTKGELQLNGYSLIILAGTPDAISHNEGYIKSESAPSGNNGLVTWKNIEQGNHTIPFGTDKQNLLPFTFSPQSGIGKDFSVATRSCAKNNRPLSTGVTNININNTDVANDRVIDRWYFVNAPGIKASITATYLPQENTTSENLSTKNFSVMNWTNGKWNILGGNGNGSVTHSATVVLQGNDKWGNLLLISNEILEKADILTFEAVLNNKQVDFNWTSLASIRVQNYEVERSVDGFNFETVLEKTASLPTGSPIPYSDTDVSPLKGISYYRLKQNNPDGKVKYSSNVRIDNTIQKTPGLEFLSVAPNPFSSQFSINYSLPEKGTVEIRLTSVNGQKAFSKTFEGEEGKNSTEVNDLENILPGIYILTLTDGKTIKNYKLFKI